MIAAENKILQLINKNKSGVPAGITSVCSANSYVLKAAIMNAGKNNTIVLIESTSNQVDQFGGYTGVKPDGFKELVIDIARESGFPIENIILGGDHLGPNRWQDEDSSSAMQKAKDQIAAYISAGYLKIHLDASMKCADDGDPDAPLNKSIIAERAAQLCRTAEDTLNNINKDYDQPVYVIGTDVPPPGGAQKEHNEIHITSAEEVSETIEMTRLAFEKYNLQDAWQRVAAVVIQPGVEFGDSNVTEYNRTKALPLINLIKEDRSLVYEAHSTDYQKKELLRQMVEDHFVILKVGPWLTYAFREAVFGLAVIEEELLSDRKNIVLSDIRKILEDRMKLNPQYWSKYYSGNEIERKLKRKYSYSDRIRYYWSDKVIHESLMRLINNLNKEIIPHTLISQFFPEQYFAVRNGDIDAGPEALILHRIAEVLEIYNYATHGGIN